MAHVASIADLASRECTPCQSGEGKLAPDAVEELGRELGREWKVIDGHHLRREFQFPDFRRALEFTNQVGELAEAQNHHPDIELGWGKVAITLWTHKAGGLTENDFVMAAKIDGLRR